MEDFTIGRRTPTGADSPVAGPGDPWDLAAFQRLLQGNEATLALLDLCATDGADGVSVQDIALHASITATQVRGQLAGLTMRMRNPKNGFTQTMWAVDIKWLAGGVACYSMPAELIPLWRQAREGSSDAEVSQNPPAAGLTDLN